MIDNTRHYHNEIVSERLIENSNGEYSKDKPDYIIYIKENKRENYKKTEKWRMTQKAASQFDIPIVIMDREAIVKNEFKKFEHLKKIFLGKIPNDTELNEYQILNELIVNFENNRISVAFSENLKDKYFSEVQRQELLDSINKRIYEFKNKDSLRFESLKLCFNYSMENELLKLYSNNGGFAGATLEEEDFWKGNIKKFHKKEIMAKAESKTESLVGKKISAVIQKRQSLWSRVLEKSLNKFKQKRNQKRFEKTNNITPKNNDERKK